MKDLIPKINSNDGLFHNGNPATGEQGTRVTDAWLNNVQSWLLDNTRELKYLLSQAGLVPSPIKTTQVYDAIIKIIDDNRNTASLTSKGEVRLTDSINDKSSSIAASGKAVKTAYDKAVLAERIANTKASTNHTHTTENITDFSNAVKRLFSGNIRENGWCKMPNGFIEQWGKVTLNTENRIDTEVIFPVKFPSEVLNVQVSYAITPSPNINRDIVLGELSLSRMTILQSADWNLPVYWRAIGK